MVIRAVVPVLGLGKKAKAIEGRRPNCFRKLMRQRSARPLGEEAPSSAESVIAAPETSVKLSMGSDAIRSWDGLEAIRKEWKDRCRHYYADVDYLKSVVAARAGVVRPHVIVLSREGAVTGLVCGWVEQRSWCFWKGRCDGGQFRALVIPFRGVLGVETAEMCDRLSSHLRQAFRNREFELAIFAPQPTDSAIVEYLLSNTSFPLREHFLRCAAHWTARLPSSAEEFFGRMSSKHRAWMRLLRRRLEAAFPGAVRFVCYANSDEIAKLAADAEAISRQTYQYRRGGGFSRSADKMARLGLGARLGWLLGYVLYVDGKPIAFWNGTQYRNAYWLDTTGYLEQFRKYEPGTMLFMHVIDDLCKRGVERLDFGWNDSFYQARFGDAKNEEYSFVLCSRRPRAMAMLALKSARNAADVTARAGVSILGAKGWLRKLIRRIPKRKAASK